MIKLEEYEFGFILGSVAFFVLAFISYGSIKPMMVGGLIGIVCGIIIKRYLKNV